ncbi:MAG TPA: hypothetical protein VGI03_05465 [Verrucomicrobiae bacterium]|jgi:hypothetical protein
MKIFFLIGIIGWLAVAQAVAAATNAMMIRIGSGESTMANYHDYGYNAAILGDLTDLVSFDAIYPNAIPVGSDLRNRIESRRKTFREDCDQAHALGLKVCVMTDEASLPVPIYNLLQQPGKPSGIDYDNPKFWEVYRAKYREFLKAYPQVAYVIVRTGENYSNLRDGYIGRTVYTGHYDDAYIKHMQRFIEETRKIVVDEFGRTLIWRTWDLGADGFHANPAVYDRILQGLPDRKGLILSIKFTQTDFWRYNDFNPMIGRGGVDQIVEFECAREYEGKGAYPDYVGAIHADAMSKAAGLGARGVWIWDFSGGWGGPFLQTDQWVRLNIYATSRLAQNPDLSARALAEEWAGNEFGAPAATNVAAMLMLSPECVRKCIYIEAYARTHSAWNPGLNLMRDDIIRGEILKKLYDGSKDSLPAVFAEKEQAVALAVQMRSMFESSRSDILAARGERVYQESLTSLIYLESLTKVMEHYVTGMFSYYQWQETRDPAAAAKARLELRAWKEAWNSYQTDVPKLPGAASLYRSQNGQNADSAKGAMADLCENAMRDLAAAQTIK